VRAIGFFAGLILLRVCRHAKTLIAIANVVLAIMALMIGAFSITVIGALSGSVFLVLVCVEEQPQPHIGSLGKWLAAGGLAFSVVTVAIWTFSWSVSALIMWTVATAMLITVGWSLCFRQRSAN
jgi:hypothetical protein